MVGIRNLPVSLSVFAKLSWIRQRRGNVRAKLAIYKLHTRISSRKAGGEYLFGCEGK